MEGKNIKSLKYCIKLLLNAIKCVLQKKSDYGVCKMLKSIGYEQEKHKEK